MSVTRITTILFSVMFVCATIFGANYYQNNQESIWLNIEQYAATVLYPFKVARLRAMDRDTKITVPVQGILLSEITDTWGAPRPTGRGHNGVDIFAERNTPVYAATSGFVTRIETTSLGGNVVFTLGAGGIRYYYAHLESVSENISIGQEVNSETIIGYVGNTGNAITTPPHLHFGIYKNGAENPYPYLVDRI